MGVFDYLRCEYPLPLAGANDLDYQTKDTESQYCDHYVIRADGSLWHQAYETEDRSDPKAEGLFRLLGCATRVNERWERDTMTGEVCFSASFDNAWADPTKHVSYSAYFVDGYIRHLVQLTPKAASVMPPQRATQIKKG